jgi:hypothetical protein
MPVWYGSVVTLFSSLGILAGGWFYDFLGRRGYRDAIMRRAWGRR